MWDRSKIQSSIFEINLVESESYQKIARIRSLEYDDKRVEIDITTNKTKQIYGQITFIQNDRIKWRVWKVLNNVQTIWSKNHVIIIWNTRIFQRYPVLIPAQGLKTYCQKNLQKIVQYQVQQVNLLSHKTVKLSTFHQEITFLNQHQWAVKRPISSFSKNQESGENQNSDLSECSSMEQEEKQELESSQYPIVPNQNDILKLEVIGPQNNNEVYTSKILLSENERNNQQINIHTNEENIETMDNSVQTGQSISFQNQPHTPIPNQLQTDLEQLHEKAQIPSQTHLPKHPLPQSQSSKTEDTRNLMEIEHSILSQSQPHEIQHELQPKVQTTSENTSNKNSPSKNSPSKNQKKKEKRRQQNLQQNHQQTQQEEIKPKPKQPKETPIKGNRKEMEAYNIQDHHLLQMTFWVLQFSEMIQSIPNLNTLLKSPDEFQIAVLLLQYFYLLKELKAEIPTPIQIQAKRIKKQIDEDLTFRQEYATSYAEAHELFQGSKYPKGCGWVTEYLLVGLPR